EVERGERAHRALGSDRHECGSLDHAVWQGEPARAGGAVGAVERELKHGGKIDDWTVGRLEFGVTDHSATEQISKPHARSDERGRWVAILTTVAATVAAWWWLSSRLDRAMATLPVFVITWTVMMAAMMLPSLLPSVLLFGSVSQSRESLGFRP